MKNPELFHKTVGILVKAYMNDTLAHANCAACAVGNIIAENTGVRIIKDGWSNECRWEYDLDHSQSLDWLKLIERDARGSKGSFAKFIYDEKRALGQIEATGYTIFELSEMENAFEAHVDVFYFEKEYECVYTSLMNVVSVLQQIHECTEEETQEAKELFVKS